MTNLSMKTLSRMPKLEGGYEIDAPNDRTGKGGLVIDDRRNAFLSLSLKEINVYADTNLR